jgi:hypothetical protein
MEDLRSLQNSGNQHILFPGSTSLGVLGGLPVVDEGEGREQSHDTETDVDMDMNIK